MRLANETIRKHEWKSRAACRGLPTDLFFSHTKRAQAKAKAICAECEVKEECRLYASRIAVNIYQDYNEISGIWGGTLKGHTPPKMPKPDRSILGFMRTDANLDGIWRGLARTLGNEMKFRYTGRLTASEVEEIWERLEAEGHILYLGD